MRKLILIIGVLVQSLIASASPLDRLTLMSEDFPPFNYLDKSIPKGYSIELLEEILKQSGSKKVLKDILFLPWARSYNHLLNQKDSVLFVTTRTKERENLFLWIGPISKAENVMMAKKDLQIKIKKVADLSNYIIGVINDDASEELVKSLGIEKNKIQAVSEAKLNIEKLESGRIHMMAYDASVTRWLYQQLNKDFSKIEIVYPLSEGQHYFAFNKQTSMEIIAEFQRVMGVLEKNGFLKRLKKKYQFE